MMNNFKGKLKLCKLTSLENSHTKNVAVDLKDIFFCQTKRKVGDLLTPESLLHVAGKLKKFQDLINHFNIQRLKEDPFRRQG